MKKVLFVCLGNICRSPAAEGVFKELVAEQKLSHEFEIDSAGTNGLHDGETADSRMKEAAKRRGYDLTSISRQVKANDFAYYDYIIPMDQNNFETLKRLNPEKEYERKILPMTSFGKKHLMDHVPDPYYGGAEGFEHVIDILEDACQDFLESLK